MLNERLEPIPGTENVYALPRTEGVVGFAFLGSVEKDFTGRPVDFIPVFHPARRYEHRDIVRDENGRRHRVKETLKFPDLLDLAQEASEVDGVMEVVESIRQSKTARVAAAVGAGLTAAGLGGAVAASQAVCFDYEDTAISSGGVVNFGVVEAQHPCNIKYAQTLPPGDLRVGGGITLNSPEFVAWYLWRDAGLLNLLAGGNAALRNRLNAGATNQREFLAESDWDVNAIDADNVVGRMPLWRTPQFVIDDNPEHEDEILRQFAEKGMRVEYQEGFGQVLTEGVAGQDIVDPRNPNKRLFVLAKIVEQGKQNLQRFLFGNEEQYWVLSQIQRFDDGRIRKLYSFVRNDCINAMLFTLKLEFTPSGEVEVTLTQTVLPAAVPTNVAPPLQLQVPGVPTIPAPEATATPGEVTPTAEATATNQPTPATPTAEATATNQTQPSTPGPEVTATNQTRPATPGKEATATNQPNPVNNPTAAATAAVAATLPPAPPTAVAPTSAPAPTAAPVPTAGREPTARPRAMFDLDEEQMKYAGIYELYS